jgi:leucyl aminopeptidase
MNKRIYTNPENILFTTTPKDVSCAIIFIFNKANEIPGFATKFGDITPTLTKSNKFFQINCGILAEFSSESARKIGGKLAKYLELHKIESINFPNNAFSLFSNMQMESFFEGIFLGKYSFSTHKSDIEIIEPIIYIHPQNPISEEQIISIHKLTFVVNLVRELGHEPANIINPATLAKIAEEIAIENHIAFKKIDYLELEKMGAGGITSVGKGSATKPSMLILEYSGSPDSDNKPIALVGKAITFDTGGYSLKSVDSIKGMKYDKMGGITVLGIILASALLGIKQNLIGVICSAENMISQDAFRPDDIITTLSGKTVEILTTDAEGRLVLADGLTFVQNEYAPRIILDFATLTGGIVTALGKIRAGLFSNNEDLATTLFEFGEKTGEKLWRMPLDEEYFEFIRGDDADLKNSGGREGHPIMGGIFLKQFVQNNTPWVHLDIAGTAESTKAENYQPKGANGFGVRLTIDWLKSLK